VFNVLLQIMDHGKLTDHSGKSVDFRNTILIMTTNAGATEMSQSSIGFGRGTKDDADDEAIKKMFSPEFRNRLDAIIAFSHLSPEIVRRVVEKFVMQLEAQLSDRDVTFEITDAAADWIVDKGYDRLYGARPMGRVIQEHIKKPLADELLFGALAKGGHVVVKVEKGDLAFDIKSSEKPSKPSKPPKPRKKKLSSPALVDGK
jgi:ATP-dependent Clp protease ATP-binding subunit ClpA